MPWWVRRFLQAVSGRAGRRLGGSGLLAVLFVGCGNAPTGPLQPDVRNSAAAFHVQADDVTNVTTTLNYTWNNSALYGRVVHSTTTDAGTARLAIRDPFGTLIYERPLAPDLVQTTQIGSPGRWAITVTLTGFSGDLDIAVQRP